MQHCWLPLVIAVQPSPLRSSSVRSEDRRSVCRPENEIFAKLPFKRRRSVWHLIQIRIIGRQEPRIRRIGVKLFKATKKDFSAWLTVKQFQHACTACLTSRDWICEQAAYGRTGST